MDIFSQILNPLSGGLVLDLATAEGGFVGHLQNKLGNYTRIIGVDISLPAIRAAQSNHAASDADWAVMDVNKLAFCGKCFDTVSLSASLHHLDQVEQVIYQIGRVTKPGGTVIIAEMHRDGQTEAQQMMIDLHHWKAALDTALGILHRPTLARQQIVNVSEKLGLVGIQTWDFSDTGMAERDEAALVRMDRFIDQQLEQLAGRPALQRLRDRGATLRERLWQVGIQSEPVVVFTGRRPAD